MDRRAPVRRLLTIVNVGFACIVGISWLDELVDLPGRLFGRPEAGPNWHEGLIETVIVLSVWLVVASVVRKMSERLHYLEKFLRVCAWCRRIQHDGKWVPVEEYFRKGFSVDTSHGMCPECAEAQIRETRDSVRRPGGGDLPPKGGPGGGTGKP